MANPNIVGVTAIYGKTAVQAVSTRLQLYLTTLTVAKYSK